MDMRVESGSLREYLTAQKKVINSETQGLKGQSVTDVNTPLQSKLFLAIMKPVSGHTLDNISNIFNDYQPAMAAGKPSHCTALAMIETWHMNSQQRQATDTESKIIMTQQAQRVSIAAVAINSVQRELLKDRVEMNYSHGLLKSALGSVQDAGTEEQGIDTHTSYAELWARIAQAIKNIKTDYVDFYADLMLKYTKMYEAFNESVQKASSSAVSSGDDGNNVKFNTGTMKDGYDDYSSALNKINLGSVKDWRNLTQEQRESMRATLEPAFKISSNGRISFNIDQYNSISYTYPSGIKDGKVSTASYQAWLATFNSAGTALQSNMQSFAQRYSQANSTFDNLNKVLSGAISSLADSAKDVLKSLT